METGELSWSDEQFRIFGYLPSEIQPTYSDFIKAIHPEDSARAQKIIQQSIKKQNPTKWNSA